MWLPSSSPKELATVKISELYYQQNTYSDEVKIHFIMCITGNIFNIGAYNVFYQVGHLKDYILSKFGKSTANRSRTVSFYIEISWKYQYVTITWLWRHFTSYEFLTPLKAQFKVSAFRCRDGHISSICGSFTLTCTKCLKSSKFCIHVTWSRDCDVILHRTNFEPRLKHSLEYQLSDAVSDISLPFVVRSH